MATEANVFQLEGSDAEDPIAKCRLAMAPHALLRTVAQVWHDVKLPECPNQNHTYISISRYASHYHYLPFHFCVCYELILLRITI